MLIDEIKKKQKTVKYRDEDYPATDFVGQAVLLSDIEEILARCTCENCKWRFTHKESNCNITAIWVVCDNRVSPVHEIVNKGFSCNQFEANDEQ